MNIIEFAVMLNNECHNYIRQIQLELHDKLDLRISRQTSYITIKSPFDTNNITPFVKHLEHLAKTVDNFTIEFKGFNYFGQNVIFLDVLKNDQLNDLHWKILQELKEKFSLEPHEFEGENIKFHASIGGFGVAGDFEKAKNYLSQYQPHFKFTAKTFGIFYYLGECNGWIVTKKVDFG